MTLYATELPAEPKIAYRALPSGTVLLVEGRPARVFDDGSLGAAQRRLAFCPELFEQAQRRVEASLIREVETLIGFRVQLPRPLRVMQNGIATAPCELR